MALFDTTSRSRGRTRPVGTTLERGSHNERREQRRNWFAKGGIFAILVVITVLAFPRTDFYEYTVQVGEEWRRETLMAPFDFALYKAPEALEAERRAVRATTPPYFRDLPDAPARLSAHRDTVEQQLDRTLEAYESFLLNQSRGRLDEARADSLLYLEARRTSRAKLSNEQWRLLLNDHVVRVPGLAGPSREPPTGPPLADELLFDAWEFGSQLLSMGVLDIARDSVHTDTFIIRNEDENTQRTQQKDAVYGLNEVYSAAEQYFQRQYETDPERANIVTAFLRAIFVPSLEFMRAETVREWQQEAGQLSPVFGKVREGETIVRQGQVITDEIKQKLTSLERAQTEERGPVLLWKRALGQLLLTLATFVIFFLYLYMVRRPIFDDNAKILLMAILFAVIIGLFAVAVRMPTRAMYAVPVAIVSVLLTVMFDSRVGLFGTLALSLIGGLLLGFDLEFTFATLFAGTLGVFSVRDIKNRGQFFLSAALVCVGYAVVLGASWLFLNRPPERIGQESLMIVVNSFFLILAYPLLWVFERTFDITTDLSLLELSDTNRPLIKELSLRSPGTFNHSLQVANLAEAAAAAIEANALLTRVGALYHDIGKMLKPEYFVENQRPGENPHDHLKPRMSALIIASHVKEGLEMGRQYNLPKRVLDFIPMHHGTSRIEYFYRKALDEHEVGDSDILESEFRYPGPRPDSKETGILMLADGVEAASRSLSDPTHKRLEALIETIVKARIEDGQLDNTGLTFRDLTKIKETFLTLLLGIYHVRVKYPGQKEREELEKKQERAETRERRASRREDAPTEETSETIQDLHNQGLVGIPEQSVPADPDEADETLPSEHRGDGMADNTTPLRVNGQSDTPSPHEEPDSPSS